MPDSLLDIGGEEELPVEPNWESLPQNELQINRFLFEYRGTASEISEKNPEVPIVFEASFDLTNIVDYYTFLEFIHNHIGRVKRFWLRYPKQMFIPVEGVSTGSVNIVCEANDFHLVHVGHERIFIETTDGSTITRHVTNASYDEADNELTITVATPIDRDISVDEFFRVGRYLLVRFDDDNFKLRLYSDMNMEISQRMVELIRDYDDLAPNP